jgi:prepilin-type N-terminal cleavage/methylation domain-containing protein
MSRFPGLATQNMNKQRIQGFTLVEVLIVTLILSVISLAIFSTFSNGLKIYNRINSEFTFEDLVIFCDRFGQDLRNSLNYTGINFTGKDDEMEFAGILNSPRMQKRTVSGIKYAFDPSKELITRFANDYSSVYSQEEESIRHSLGKVKSCMFSYYYFDNQTREFAWLELEFKDNPEVKLTRTFNIPVGNVLNDTEKEE